MIATGITLAFLQDILAKLNVAEFYRASRKTEHEIRQHLFESDRRGLTSQCEIAKSGSKSRVEIGVRELFADNTKQEYNWQRMS